MNNNQKFSLHRETLSWPSKIAEGSPLSGDAILASVRICLTPRSRRGNLEQGTKTMLKPKKSSGTNFGEKGSRKSRHIGRRSQFWQEGQRQLGWRRGQCGTQIQKVNLQKVDGLVEILYISEENIDEDPEIRVSLKDDRKIGKKMKETMFVKEKSIGLEKVRLYVQSMAKGDLEVNRVEPKSNQLAPLVAAMETAPATSKPAGVVEKKTSRVLKILKRKNQGC